MAVGRFNIFRYPRRSFCIFVLIFSAAYFIRTIVLSGKRLSHWNENKLLSDYLQQISGQNVEASRKFKSTNSANEIACKLPNLDPEHPKVMAFIKDIGPLKCAGKTFSSFEKDVLRVEGDGILSVKYWTVVRPEGNDFARKLVGPKVIVKLLSENETKLKEASISYVEPGKFGCIQHKVSQACFHPFGGGKNVVQGTKLVFHSDCCEDRIRFLMEANGAIRHIHSGMCLKAEKKEAKSVVTFSSYCDHFESSKLGGVKLKGTKLCLVPLDGSVKNDAVIGLGKCDGKKHALTFNFASRKATGFFKGNATVKNDFVRVDVETGDGVQQEIHMQVQPKAEVAQRKVTPLNIPLNVILIMFDSTSAAHFQRKMKKTISYLKGELDAVFLKGHTIVGDGTTAQIAAMLTGIAEADQPEARRSMPNSEPCDKWRFLFKDFVNNGYATFFSEDSPSTGTFTYRLKGFSVPPTDHYGRPGWLEGDSITRGYCVGTQATHRVQLEYLHSMLHAYKNPKFTFTLFSGLTHDNENSLGYADEDLTKFLQKLKQEGFTENSMIVIFGDHGFRFAGIRKTLQGKLEERLPQMAISLPRWFPKRFPQLFDSLQNNSNLLTTPFDMYATMKHILSYPDKPDGIGVGQSLFTPINASKRACSNNGVEDHWCPCLDWQDLSIDDSIVKEIVNYVIKFMNDAVSANPVASKLCSRLSLKEISVAQQQLPNEKMQTFEQSFRDNRCDSCGVVTGSPAENTLARDTVYQVQFTTSPNNGVYESSVKLNKGKPSLTGDISRLDRYGRQPYCIQTTYVHLVKFCLCVQQ